MYEIVPQTAYGGENSNYYDETTRAYKEQYNTGGEQRPAIHATLTNAAQYDVVFLGSPIWYSKSPRVILTFLDTYGFAGKTIVPFVTSASTGITKVNEELPATYPNIYWIEGRRLNGVSDADLQTWVQGVLESATGIEDVQATQSDAPAYTMSGQQAQEGYKGVVIQNGKKQIK